MTPFAAGRIIYKYIYSADFVCVKTWKLSNEYVALFHLTEEEGSFLSARLVRTNHPTAVCLNPRDWNKKLFECTYR